MEPIAVKIRFPRELHKLLTHIVQKRKEQDPGASLNSLVLEGMRKFVMEEAQKHE